MIKFENPNGYIEITNNYFSNLVGNAAQSCFGVTRMVSPSAYQTIKTAIKNKVDSDNASNGVFVKHVNGELIIDIHVAVSYGVNIATISDSIVNRVRYTVESATQLKVSEVNVHIEGIDE